MDNWMELYKNGGYGGFGSGTGSILKNNLDLIKWLHSFIEKNNIKSIVDIPCGDMQWMPALLNISKIRYVGIDYVDYLINDISKKHSNLEFLCMDILNLNFKLDDGFDLLICKDIVQHCNEQELSMLFKNIDNINAKYKLVITPWNFPLKNKTFIHEYQSDYIKLIYLL